MQIRAAQFEEFFAIELVHRKEAIQTNEHSIGP